MEKNRRLGVGSLSLLFFILAIAVSNTIINKKPLGEHVFNFLQLNIPESIITITLLILAATIGIKFKDHLFAKIGAILSQIVLGLLVIFLIIDFVRRLFGFFF
ncbi:hypothetical protein [Gracilibacillus lacisalsi]|uniref:hypothetical protein n=1 Tax=Gracilibacillus lacisalsi TaxID=393087 RepID=UPI0003624069|nr:hypothetical protein [Gracilibacillus lacisalsi]